MLKSLFIKKRLQHRYIPVNIEKFLGTAFFIEHFSWLLLLLDELDFLREKDFKFSQSGDFRDIEEGVGRGAFRTPWNIYFFFFFSIRGFFHGH